MDSFSHHHNHNKTPIGVPEPVPVPSPVPSPYPHDGHHGHGGPFAHVERISKMGHVTLSVTCAIMAISTVIFILHSFRVPTQKSLFHRITIVITSMACVSYWFMAQGAGVSLVRTAGHNAREVYWARDIDWLVTTPLLLLDMSLLAGLPIIDIISIMVADVAMIILGLISGQQEYTNRWIPFAASWACLFYIIFKLLIQGNQSAKLIGPKTAQLFRSISIFSMIIWTGYPIVFLLSYLPHGHPILSPNTEVLLYAIHDILAKPVFGLWLLYTFVNFEDSEPGYVLPESWCEPQGSNYGQVRIEDN